MNPEQLDQKLRTITKHEAHLPLWDAAFFVKGISRLLYGWQRGDAVSYAAISEENNGAPFLVKKRILAFAATLYTSMIGSN